MTKIAMAALVAVVAVAVAGLALYARKGSKSSDGRQVRTTDSPSFQQTLSQNEVIVEMGEDSYNPAKLAIPRGTSVAFKNVSSESRWPASNIHPTHEIYPAFDSRRPIPPGASWSFTFDQEGVWRYHDHLVPEIAGTIIVE